VQNVQTHLNVVQSTSFWLSQTMVWLYTQIQNLPDDCVNTVVASKVDNLEHFPQDSLFCPTSNGSVLPLICRHSYRISEWRRERFIKKALAKKSPTLLHSHFGDRGWMDMPLAVDAEAPHIVTFYGYDASRLPKLEPMWLDRYAELFESVSAVLCEGPFFARTIAALGCPADKLKVQHLSVDLHDIPFRVRQWERSKQPLKILLVGTFVEKKGFPYALEAISRIKDKTTVQITIVGDAIDQPRSQAEKARILECIEKFGLQSCTQMIGYLPYQKLIELAMDHHLLMSPSVTASDGDAEGGAPVTLIAMSATGMPIISSTHCDIPEVVVNGKTGLLSAERNVDEISEHLQWFIDQEDWSEISHAARLHITREFNSIEQGQRLGSIYRSVLG
jgi:colanic acid/amylovoran/stewartan biosynthesis glycosyltransferase WcaL/AmsK/CpsK